MQYLASVERITDLRPIEGADFIQTASVLGWEVVVKKDEFRVGDLAAYIQIDTIVPETEQFEFLRERQFRIRTVKLRKQVSQGLLVPLPAGNYKEGDDLTTVLSVTKYSKDPDAGQFFKKPKIWYKKLWYILKYNYLVKLFPGLQTFNRSRFPTNLVPITDEERIQNIPHVLELYKNKLFIVSEKLDGSSITIIHQRKWNGKSKYRVCSRRFELFNNKNEWSKVFESTDFEKHIQKLIGRFKTPNVIVQGEFIGSPQGNKYKLRENEIRLFNIYVNGKRLVQDDFVAVCRELQIPSVPFLGMLKLNEAHYALDELVKMADGKSELNNTIDREGLVFRCIEGDGKMSFKVISNKFLLKNGE